MSLSPHLGTGVALPSTSQQQQQYIPYLGAPHVVPVATPYVPATSNGSSLHNGETSYFQPHQQRHDSFSSGSITVSQSAGPSNANGQSGSPVQALMAGQQNARAASNKRAIQSCAECNRVIPCGPCMLRGEEASCKEVEKIEPVHMPVPTMVDFEAAISRIQELESSVVELRRLMIQGSAAQELQLPAGIARHGDPRFQSALSGGASGSAPLAGPSVEREHEDMAMILEDFAMNNRANRDRAVQSMGAAGTSTASDGEPAPEVDPSLRQSDGGSANMAADFVKDSPVRSLALPPLPVPESQYGGRSTNLAYLEPSHPLSGFGLSVNDYVLRFLSQCPDSPRAWQLIQFYFDHLEWYSRVLHAPTFLEECESFLANPQQAANTARPSFLATYFIVLCIALHYVGDQEKADLGYTSEQTHTMCLSMFSAAQAMLHLSDYLAVHSLENLQVILLMGVYQYNVGQSDSHWSMLGSAIKIAQNIGLSRLGGEKDGVRWPERWRDPLKREIGRRVWWNLIFLDWSHAIAHNATYSIHPSQNFTDFPSNVNDADIRQGQPIVSRAPDEYTESSFTICKLRFVVLYRELVDHHLAHNPPSYPFILDMDTRIVRALDTLPPFFRSAPATTTLNDTRIMECLLIQLIGESRLLRLHRPYLTRGYRERTFAPSKDRCVHSARSIQVLLKTAEKASPILLGTWLVLFYGFGAAVVTFIDLCHGTAAGDEASSAQKRQQIRDTVALLQAAKNISDAARGATALLEGLLAAEEEMSTHQRGLEGNKRKADTMEEGDPFKRVVKKLLVGSGQSRRPRLSESSPASSSMPNSQLSPALQSTASLPQSNGQTQSVLDSRNQTIQVPPSMDQQYTAMSMRPLPFAPDLDLFLEGTKTYAQLSSVAHTPSGAATDATSMDLSYLLSEDMLSSLFAEDPLLGLQYQGGNGTDGAW